MQKGIRKTWESMNGGRRQREIGLKPSNPHRRVCVRVSASGMRRGALLFFLAYNDGQ